MVSSGKRLVWTLNFSPKSFCTASRWGDGLATASSIKRRDTGRANVGSPARIRGVRRDAANVFHLRHLRTRFVGRHVTNIVVPRQAALLSRRIGWIHFDATPLPSVCPHQTRICSSRLSKQHFESYRQESMICRVLYPERAICSLKKRLFEWEMTVCRSYSGIQDTSQNPNANSRKNSKSVGGWFVLFLDRSSERVSSIA